MTFFVLFYEVGTAVWPREFYHGRGSVYLMHCLLLIGNFGMVDSPRFPKSSGIDPKKALVVMASVRWATGERLTDHLPKLGPCNTLPPFSEQRGLWSPYGAVRA